MNQIKINNEGLFSEMFSMKYNYTIEIVIFVIIHLPKTNNTFSYDCLKVNILKETLTVDPTEKFKF